jgi:hypothetical protein
VYPYPGLRERERERERERKLHLFQPPRADEMEKRHSAGNRNKQTLQISKLANPSVNVQGEGTRKLDPRISPKSSLIAC